MRLLAGRQRVSILLSLSAMALGLVAMPSWASAPQADDICYKPFWVVKNGKPVLERVRKSPEELSLPNRYVCEYGSHGSVHTADLKLETCHECGNNPQQALNQMWGELSVKVSRFRDSPTLRTPTAAERRKFGGAGVVVMPRDCQLPVDDECKGKPRKNKCWKDCSNGSGNLVLEDQDIVIACAHEFFQDGKALNRYSKTKKNWWSGYKFKAVDLNGRIVERSFTNGKVYSRRLSTDPDGADIVVLKLRSPMKSVSSKGIIPYSSGLHAFGKQNPPTMYAHHLTRIAAGDVETHLPKITDYVPLKDATRVADVGGSSGEHFLVTHRAATYPGSSGGGFYFTDPSDGEILLGAIHCHGSREESRLGQVIDIGADHNQAIGISQKILEDALSL